MTQLAAVRFAVVTLSLAASACSAEQTSDEAAFGPDAGQIVRPDAAPEEETATPDAPLDAAPVVPPGDACVPQVTQLLINPSFDMAPRGMGWQERLASPNAPLITSEDGVIEHTPVAKAWLGGFEAPTTTALLYDAAYQDILIPAGTTNLVVTGFHQVRTAEDPTTVDYDKSKITVTDLNGVVISTVLSLSNTSSTAPAWTAFGYAFTQDLSGKTVRFRIASSNDDLKPTSFFFDSLAVTATHGCAPTLP